MELLSFNTERHQNIAFRVSSTPYIHVKSTHTHPASQDGDIFRKLVQGVWNSLIKICTCHCKGRSSNSEKQNTSKAPCRYSAITEALITHKLVRPASYIFNFMNTLEDSCKGQSSVQRPPSCKHISLCNRNRMPHIQYCKFCRTVFLEQANIL